MSEKRIDLFNLFRNEGKLETLYVYSAKKTQEDPYEKNTTKIFMNPLPIKALIRQVSYEVLHWKYFGNIPVGSVEIIAEKKYLTLFRTADKIKYKDEYFKTWQEDSKGFAILERPDYIIIILSKKVNND
jgi:hypothetical protein